ncbi:MAG: hypothetical protein ACRC1K_27165 [Planctomycetia bacterium]
MTARDDQVFTGWTDDIKYQAHRLCETGGGSLVPRYCWRVAPG